MFAEAAGTTISCSLGRKYGPVLSLYFFDIYGGLWGSLNQSVRFSIDNSWLPSLYGGDWDNKRSILMFNVYGLSG